MPPSTLTIHDLSTRAVNVPLARPLATASGAIPSAPLVLIDLTTEEGPVGRAYVFAYTALALAPLMATFANLARVLRGQTASPAAIYDHFEKKFRLLGRQGFLGMAISGIDMALWDVAARAQDLSVARLLGGEERPLTAYDSYGIIEPRRDRAQLERSLAQGFRALKIKLGGRDLQADFNTLQEVRAIVGPGIQLMVDYNQSLSAPEARRRIDRLAVFDLLWVEEPVPAEDLTGHARVRQASRVAIQTGENWWFPEDAARAIAMGASDFAMLDLMKIGGVTGWQRAAALAAGAALPVSSHIFPEASAHVLAVTPGAHFLEYLDLAGAVLKDPPRIEDGELTPQGPGLGLSWDPDAVERYAA